VVEAVVVKVKLALTLGISGAGGGVLEEKSDGGLGRAEEHVWQLYSIIR